MAKYTHISWADATWPLTAGCTKVSPGCANCYAMRDARRMEHNPHPQVSSVYSDLVRRQDNGLLNWTGTIKTLPQRLDMPARWKEHRTIFVCSQSDLFHEDVPDDFIAQVFNAMWNYSWHDYLILTKRPERLLVLMRQAALSGLADFNPTHFPHVMVGVSIEDQTAAKQRIQLLLATGLPAPQLFLSCEPLLGPLDLSPWLDRLGWIIVGGESGKSARAMDIEWIRDLRDQCATHKTALHVKQLGSAWAKKAGAKHAKGGDPAEWPEDLSTRDFPVDNPPPLPIDTVGIRGEER